MPIRFYPTNLRRRHVQHQDMYRTVLKDTFPDTMTITLGDAVLTYKKRTWHIDGETKGLRYGENPDQPAALYEMESGKLAIDGVEWRGPQGIMSALTEAQMLQGREASRQDQPHRRGQRLQHPPIPRGTPRRRHPQAQQPLRSGVVQGKRGRRTGQGLLVRPHRRLRRGRGGQPPAGHAGRRPHRRQLF